MLTVSIVSMKHIITFQIWISFKNKLYHLATQVNKSLFKLTRSWYILSGQSCIGSKTTISSFYHCIQHSIWGQNTSLRCWEIITCLQSTKKIIFFWYIAVSTYLIDKPFVFDLCDYYLVLKKCNFTYHRKKNDYKHPWNKILKLIQTYFAK